MQLVSLRTLYMCSTLLPPATSSRCLLLHAKLNTGQPVDTTCSQHVQERLWLLAASWAALLKQLPGDKWLAALELLTCSRLPLSVHTPMLPSIDPENSNLALVV